jgi:hypothetical protein
MIKRIFLRQVLETIKKVDVQGIAIPFDIEFRTRNKNNNTGGVLKKYQNAKLLIGTKQKGKPFIDAEHFYRKERIRKNPNHFENATRNIELENGRIIKINFRYITKFNDQEVIY